MRKISVSLIVFLVYIAVSLYFFRFSLTYFDKVTIPSLYGDSLDFLWGIKWFLYALTHHLNPLVSYKVLGSAGTNLSWCPGNSFSADFLTLPVTLIFGPIVSYNILVVLSPALAAFTAYLLCFYLTKKHFPSLIGGYIYGFSSYEFGQLLAHPNLFGGIFLMPLIILIVAAFYRNIIKKYIFLIILTIFLILVWGFSLEIFSTMTFFGYSAIVIIFALDKENRRKILSIVKLITLSYIIAMIILSPYIYYLYIGLKFIPKTFHPIAFFSSDLLNYIIPTPITWLGGNLFAHISTGFTGDFAEDGAYMGIPLIIIFFIYIKKNIKYIYTKIILLISLVLFISSLGPILHVAGKIIIPLPWKIMTFVPLMRQALPTRFTLYLFLILSIVVALFLSSKKFNKYFKYGMILLGILFLIPNQSFFANRFAHYTKHPNIPQFFRKGLYKTYMKQNTNVLIIPYGYQNGSFDALYQAESNFYFNLESGIAVVFPFKKWPWLNSPMLTSLNQNRPGLIDYRMFKSFLAYNNIKYVIVNNSYYAKWSKLIKFKYKKVSGVFLYKVPSSILDNPNYKSYNLSVRYNNLKIFSTLFSASKKFLKKGNNISNLFPRYLEKHGYLSKSFGYYNIGAINWTQNGGWIGRGTCLDEHDECFGIGLMGSADTLKSIIQKYKSQALQIFFPYPKGYDPYSFKKTGQLLMIFRASKPN